MLRKHARERPLDADLLIRRHESLPPYASWLRIVLLRRIELLRRWRTRIKGTTWTRDGDFATLLSYFA